MSSISGSTVRPKPVLFSIHGISTRGEWQEGVDSVFSPFFQYKCLKYSDFRRGGILKLSVDLLVPLVVLLVALVLVWRGSLRLSPGALGYVAIAVIAVLGIHLWMAHLRVGLTTRIYKSITAHATLTPKPCIIAHSLGTHLVCSAITKFPSLKFNVLILGGCVVEKTYAWERVSAKFESVFNEVAGGDRVPLAAALLGWTIRGMGSAGTNGFDGPMVHEGFLEPNEARPGCTASKMCCDAHGPTCESRVHNIRHGLLDHSDYFNGVSHAWTYWLPSVLRYDPMLFHQFREKCQACSNALLPTELEATASELGSACWGWTAGSLENFTRTQLVLVLVGQCQWTEQQMDDLVMVTVRTLWKLVSRAAEESKKREDRRDKAMAMLEPRTALRSAIKASVYKFRNAAGRG